MRLSTRFVVVRRSGSDDEGDLDRAGEAERLSVDHYVESALTTP